MSISLVISWSNFIYLNVNRIGNAACVAWTSLCDKVIILWGFFLVIMQVMMQNIELDNAIIAEDDELAGEEVKGEMAR